MSKISFSERVILVDILAAIFGISSWVEVNGVWVQSPILVQKLPEQWKLASYVAVITQLANIGPIVYSILKLNFSLKSIEKPTIHLTLLIGSVACLFLTLFWDKITVINGSPHSVTFFALTALLAVVDCTTNVLYLPFMAHFKSKYLMSYLIGQGLSGLIPSIIAIVQGIGGNPTCVNSTETNSTTAEYPEPRFSVSVFFIFLMVLVLLSWLAFILLNHLKSCQSERVTHKEDDDRHLQRVNNSTESDSSQSIHNSNEVRPNSESSLTQNNEQNISKKSFIILLLTQAYICSLTNGVLPSIQSYSCLPYGNTAYHLTVTLSSMANPIACFVAFYMSSSAIKRSLPIVISCGTIFAAYIISTAVLSPSPPLQDLMFGKILIIFVWIAFTALFSYSRACIAQILRNTSTGHKSLFYCGVFTQIGSAFGAILMFSLINWTTIFNAYYPCT